MAQRGSLRASDADREQIAERLRRATGEGRLAADELEQRLGSALSARTYAELDKLVADLPGRRVGHPSQRPPARRALSTVAAHPLLALAALPLLLAALAIATGLATLWAVWVLIAWLAFGHHGRYDHHALRSSGHPRRGLGPHPRHRIGPGHYRA